LLTALFLIIGSDTLRQFSYVAILFNTDYYYYSLSSTDYLFISTDCYLTHSLSKPFSTAYTVQLILVQYYRLQLRQTETERSSTYYLGESNVANLMPRINGTTTLFHRLPNTS
jgi:hypothetical protein